MSLSKLDLLDRKISRSLFGYNTREVDELLSEAAEALGALAEERTALKRRMAAIEERLSEHKREEAILRETMLTTQRIVEDVKANARKEAQLVIDEAHAKAESMMTRAHQRVAHLHDEATSIKRQRARFEAELRGLLETHAKILDVGREESQELEIMESKIAFINTAK